LRHFRHQRGKLLVPQVDHFKIRQCPAMVRLPRDSVQRQIERGCINLTSPIDTSLRFCKRHMKSPFR
jgi:hypothetical protein